MLVLSRKRDESILIGDDIEIVVIDVRGTKEEPNVRIGIIAPSNITIHRKEVAQRIAEENFSGSGILS